MIEWVIVWPFVSILVECMYTIRITDRLRSLPEISLREACLYLAYPSLIEFRI